MDIHRVDRVDTPLLDQVMSSGFRWLRFPAQLERAFIIARAEDRTFKLILAGLCSVVMFNGMLPVDYMLLPGHFALALLLRLGIYAPLCVLSVFVLYRLSYPEFNEWSVVFFAALASAITAVLATSGVHPLTYTKMVEQIIAVVYVAVFTRFWPMVLLSLIALLVHFGVLLTIPDPIGNVRLGGTLMLVTTLSFALQACYVRERNDRLAFLKELKEQELRCSLNEANARLDEMAGTDALTGVANRRAFDAFLARLLDEREASVHSPALLLVDVDHFKAFNDRYGHHAGDDCLRAVADAISACLRRPVDMVARWGGEEFAVVLGDADAQTALQVAERIRLAIADRNVPHTGSSCAQHVTVSIGVATPAAGVVACANDLIHRADEALYQAKEAGRNRVVRAALASAVLQVAC